MKRGTPRHPKTAALCARLNIPLYQAVGILEMLWHFTAEYAPQGDIGKYEDRWVEASLGFLPRGSRRCGDLVRALLDTGWLDVSTTYRLVVHDWHDHCDEYVKRKLERAKLPFLSGQPVREFLTDHRRTDSDTQDESVRLPMPVPMPVPCLAVPGQVPTAPEDAPIGAGVTEISSKPKTKGKKRDPPEWLRHWFEGRFWPSRWRNEGKAYALLCLAQKVDTEAQAEAELLSMLAQREQYLRRPTDKRPHMSTWINQDRAKDEPELFDSGSLPVTKQDRANLIFQQMMEREIAEQRIQPKRLS